MFHVTLLAIFMADQSSSGGRQQVCSDITAVKLIFASYKYNRSYHGYPLDRMVPSIPFLSEIDSRLAS